MTIWAALLSLASLPAWSADTITVKPFMGTEVPRLQVTIPGAEIGLTRSQLNPIPLIVPMGELAAIPFVPNIPQLSVAAMPAGLNALLIAPSAGLGTGFAVPGQDAEKLATQLDVTKALGANVENLTKLADADSSGIASSIELGNVFSGSRGGRRSASVSTPKSADLGIFRPNADGVTVMGRAEEYDRESTRIVKKYQGKIDFSEATDVMDDAYAEAYARATILEHESKKGTADAHSSHLPMTLTWVDGVVDQGDKKVAVHTSRVFFHHAKNPESEINEGIRRVKHTIADATYQFREGGKAESKLGQLDEVVLGFDTRGYKEIKDFIKTQEAEVRKQYGDRFRFVYLDEVAKVPQTIAEMRTAVNDLINEHREDGTLNVIEGVIYSRYTGLLLELKTAEYYYNKGYKILQGGRELFDANGHYITELDVVVRSPQGVTYLVEAKSARVPLTQKDVMDGKILYKLDTYQKNQKRLEENDIMGGPLNVVFSVDVGVPPADAPTEGREEYIKRQRQLMTFLRSSEKDLSAKYGFPVQFLFLYSTPGHDPVSPDEVGAGPGSYQQDQARGDNGRNRKHGRR
jgi:hypothetical protein